MRVQGLPEEEVAARTEEALKTFGLDGDRSPFTRSRGERQRIALASVLVGKPELVILDEPTTGLDYKECTAIMEHIAKLNREEGLTILMVCHDMELIQSYAERVLVLNGGTLLGDGPHPFHYEGPGPAGCGPAAAGPDPRPGAAAGGRV